MKKLLFAATLMALLPLLFSCGKENNGGENKFEEPRFVQYAGKLIPRGGDPAPASLAIGQRSVATSIVYLEFTESGMYVLGRNVNNDVQYVFGSYTVSGNVYTLSNFGTVEFNNSAEGEIDVKITPTGSAAETIKANLKKSSSPNVAYRTWTIDKVRMTVSGWGAPISAEFNGCSLPEIAKFLTDNGFKGVYLPSCSLNTISFTGSGSILFAFSDNTVDVGECTISGSVVNFSWTSKNRLFELENGRATIDYLDGKCILKIDGKLRDSTTSGTVTFVMSPMK